MRSSGSTCRGSTISSADTGEALLWGEERATAAPDAEGPPGRAPRTEERPDEGVPWRRACGSFGPLIRTPDRSPGADP